MTGYTVGQPHPAAERRRQWHELSEGETADVADAVVGAFAAELRRLNVAGGDLAPTWQVAERIRDAILDHHQGAHRRVTLERSG